MCSIQAAAHKPMIKALPTEGVMYQAIVQRDSSFEGVFTIAVKTTGIFCRPGCSARTPKPENVEYFKTNKEAELAGYRACKVCKPTQSAGTQPGWVTEVINQFDREGRLSDAKILELGVDPVRVRRWFKKHYGLTFQAWQRERRISMAHDSLKGSQSVTETAFAAGFDSLSGFGEAFHKVAGCSPVAGRDRKLIKVKRLLTPLGPMFVAGDDDGICLLEFDDRKALDGQLTRLQRVLDAQFIAGEHSLFTQLERELEQYFAGHLQQFSTSLQLAGTPFQCQAWNALINIPFGETRSYAQQAEAIGNPKAVRAVARANGQNALAIIVPCHRVVGKDGTLTGYAGGLWRKQKLLDLEIQRKQPSLL
ncbi:MAG: bifunctional transcriptional activator/DNA repair enzyme AdaA [Pseudomonadales bacterium]